jgi:fibronectin type 3 domain-containing protein
MSRARVNLLSGHVFDVTLTYQSGALKETVTDAKTNASFSTSYAVNIPSIVGGDTAYAGFTGGTGGLSAVQNILSWTYSPYASVAPAAPSKLKLAAATGTQIDLRWRINSANQTGFNIYRSTNGRRFTQIATTAPSASTYMDGALSPNVAYYYRVTATNPFGESAYATAGPLTTPIPPQTPTGVVVSAVSGTTVSLTWKDNANNETGYKVLRKSGLASDFSEVGALGPNSTAFTDTGLTPGVTYDYHVQAYNIAGYSDFTGLTVTTVPPAPTAVTAQSSGGRNLVSWTAAPGASSYAVYRSTSTRRGSGSLISSRVKGGSFSDSAIQLGTTYYYTVVAANSSGSSAPSAAASAQATFSAAINFSSTPIDSSTGYITDEGNLYGKRAGMVFGWNQDNSANAFSRGSPSSPDAMHDGFVEMQAASDPRASWSVALPDGTYTIDILAGDPEATNGVYDIDANGAPIVSGRPTADDPWVEGAQTVTVTNGLLTLTSASGARRNKIDSIQIIPVYGRRRR